MLSRACCASCVRRLAIDTAENARALLGADPRIAMLSFVTGAVPDKPNYASAAKARNHHFII